jgi:AcrR family transcriptional regulator
MTSAQSIRARVERAAEMEDETSRRILDAAVDRFATFGIRRTTMDDVAAAAGIGRATLYRRFAGRDDIVRAAVFRELARFVEEVDARVQELQGPVERFVEGFVAILSAARRHPLLNRLLEIEPELILPFLTVQAGPVLELNRDYLARQLRASQRDGSMRQDIDPEIVAELLVRLCQSLLLTPSGLLIGSDDEEGLRRLAYSYLAPALFTGEPGPGDTSARASAGGPGGDG